MNTLVSHAEAQQIRQKAIFNGPLHADDVARLCETVIHLTRALDEAEAAVQRVREQAQKWADEYGDPVYRDNGWAQGVLSAATEIIRTLDGDA